MTALQRLKLAVEAVSPIDGVSGAQGSITVHFKAEATAPQQAAAQTVVTNFDWSQGAQDVFDNTSARTSAKDLYDLGPNADAKVLRAVVATLIDEVNIIRQWIAAYKVEVASATNLSNLQTRVAALPNLPDRTAAQARTVLRNKVDAD